MATMEVCSTCGAPAPLIFRVCHYCGGSTFADPGAETPPAGGAADRAPAGDGGVDESTWPGDVPAEPPIDGAVSGEADDEEADDEAEEDAGEEAEEEEPDDAGAPPPAPEARRFRGLAVPLVAAAVVAGIGLPLTAIAVSQVGRLPDTARSSTGGPRVPTPGEPLGGSPGLPLAPPPDSEGEARLTGAVTFDGPPVAIGCSNGPPRLMKLEAGGVELTVLIGVPPDAAEGKYQLQDERGTFVAVSRLTGGLQTWTSRNQPEPTGEVEVRGDGSVSARFRGLKPTGAGTGTGGTVDGDVEVRCV